MTYNIAICDDSADDVNYISSLVKAWADLSGNVINIMAFPSAEAFLFCYAENKAYDILLLDIEMGGMDGVKLAKMVRIENKEVQIIFITGYNDYIAEGYEVEALHYLLKPVTGVKLSEVLYRAAERLKHNENALFIETGGEAVRLPFYEIRFLEVRQNYVTIHAKENYTVKRTLAEIEKELDDGFFRTGRSFIVNLKYIRKITRTNVILSDSIFVPLSRGLYDTLNQAMIKHF